MGSQAGVAEEKKVEWGRNLEKCKKAFLSLWSAFAFWMGLEVNRGRKTPNSRHFFLPICSMCVVYITKMQIIKLLNIK